MLIKKVLIVKNNWNKYRKQDGKETKDLSKGHLTVCSYTHT